MSSYKRGEVNVKYTPQRHISFETSHWLCKSRRWRKDSCKFRITPLGQEYIISLYLRFTMTSKTTDRLVARGNDEGRAMTSCLS